MRGTHSRVRSGGSRRSFARELTRLGALTLLLATADARAQQVVGFAKLDAPAFEPGPTSGQFLDGVAPFENRQPVQGFSGLVHGDEGTLWVLADNGFGARGNSADHVLRLFEIQPDFESGTVEVLASIPLRDPGRRVPFPIVAEGEHYPGSDILVDGRIRDGRWLTGADFDPESCQRAPDGTLWIGDEFGPFLLHFGSDGTLLAAPHSLWRVHSPQNPLQPAEEALARASGGFEGLALDPAGQVLYALLEKSLLGDPPGRLAIYRFDVEAGVYDPLTPYRWYPLESPEHHVGDLAALESTRFLVIERDDLEGPRARFKRIFLIDLDLVDADGLLRKREVVDLLNVPDPSRRTGGETYRMPLVTIEGLLVYDDHTLCVVNDNNFPFSVGRHLDTGAPDDDEIVLIGFEQPLTSLRVP